MVQLLLDRGADIHAADKVPNTMSQCASPPTHSRDCCCGEVFRRHDCDICIREWLCWLGRHTTPLDITALLSADRRMMLLHCSISELPCASHARKATRRWCNCWWMEGRMLTRPTRCPTQCHNAHLLQHTRMFVVAVKCFAVMTVIYSSVNGCLGSAATPHHLISLHSNPPTVA